MQPDRIPRPAGTGPVNAQLAFETRTILAEVIRSLESIRPETGGKSRGRPQYFFAISAKTRLFINIRLCDRPTIDLDLLLEALIEILEDESFADEEISGIMVGRAHLLVESRGPLIFAVAFNGPVEDYQIRGMHAAAGQVLAAFPELSDWQGDVARLPPDFRKGLETLMLTGKLER